jgi:hypothetical protein
MRTSFPILILFLVALSFLSCEQEFFPEPTTEEPDYVVEGYIEAGPGAIPTYVLLTQTFNFYGYFGPEEFSAAFVHNADVRVSDGDFEVALQEVCYNDLDSTIREQIAAQFGFNADSLSINFCVYIDLLNQIQPQIGKTYNLFIVAGGDTVTSTTRIPELVPLDSLWFGPPPGEPSDTLAALNCYIADPPGIRNFYRYFGSTNGGPLETAFSSVEEDLFFDGKSFEFQLFNPATDDGDVEPEEFGLYFVGDTITVKWCTIDEANFDFWNTLEFANANQGPFSSYTRLQSNIQGGLGVWGGYSVSYHNLIVAY